MTTQQQSTFQTTSYNILILFKFVIGQSIQSITRLLRTIIL